MSGNSEAVGLPLDALETPALCLDIDAYRRNVARMADYIVRQHGLGWRPHMKGQKAPELAKEAIAAGARGVTCATVYEAEVMVRAGVAGVLVANQIAGERKLARLARLQCTTPVMAATDSLDHARALDAAAQAGGVTIPVLIEVDIGMQRCGIAPGGTVAALAREIAGLRGLCFLGVMGWEGHTLAYGGDAKREQIAGAIGKLTASAEACRAAGIPVEIVSASGSGTFRLSAPLPGLTEVQAGGGVFSDLSYAKWGLDHEFALTVVTRVVSRPSPTRIIVDGGFKTMSVQHGQPRPLGLGAIKSLVLSAEHGNVELEQPNSAHRVGDLITFIPGYTDSTVCLHDELCVLRNGLLEAVWAIPGRTGRR
ncbi:MAG TPA: alanine racemase [Bryobacteraceae bacterium]|nr:alanine racemase [Bryobacteraceae bacterium]